MALPRGGYTSTVSRSNWNLACWFLWREENRRTGRKTLGAGTRTNNKLNPHVTTGPGIEPGLQRWEASALITAPSLLPCCWFILANCVQVSEHLYQRKTILLTKLIQFRYRNTVIPSSFIFSCGDHNFFLVLMNVNQNKKALGSVFYSWNLVNDVQCSNKYVYTCIKTKKKNLRKRSYDFSHTTKAFAIHLWP